MKTSYTASERRGVLAIGLVALLIIGCGFVFSWCSGPVDAENEKTGITEYPEMVDSVAAAKRDSKEKKKKSGKKTKSSSKSKSKKTYRQRSPLDEPV